MDVNAVLTTREGKINFLKGLIRLAKCDENIDPKEIEYFRIIASSLGLEEDDIELISDYWNSTEKLSVNFETQREKMLFLIQAVQLGWLDNEYAEIERQEIRDISNEMGEKLENLELVEKWVEEGIAWSKKGEELLDLQ